MTKDLIEEDQPITQGLNNQQRARLGYRQEARSKELRTPKAEMPLGNLYMLPDFGSLVESPPNKQELRFMPKDIQEIMPDLVTANKAKGRMPQLEQDLAQLKYRRLEVFSDSKLSRGEQAEMLKTLDNKLKQEEQELSNIRSNTTRIVTSAQELAKNNPDLISNSNDRLRTLRKEVSLPYSLQEARDGLPKVTKTVGQLLSDIEKGGNWDERARAIQALRDMDVEPAEWFQARKVEAMSPIDQLVEDERVLNG